MARLLQIIDGKPVETKGASARDLSDEDEFSWLHLDGRDDGDQAWLTSQACLRETVRGALLARETRPRTEFVDDGALVNLRGLGETPEDDPDPLTSIRFWATAGRIVSVSYRTSASLEAVVECFLKGEVTTPGDLLAEFARDMSERLDPKVADLGDTIDFCEARLDAKRAHSVRRRVSRARSEAIAYRRFIVPQLHAVEALATTPAEWVEKDDREHLRAAQDRFARMAEELEAVRERSALISEELTDLRAEQLDRRSLLLSIVALIFLPLTFITGLFGMNTRVPWEQDIQGFWIVLAVCALITVSLLGWFARRHWLGER
jgi:zinc transporter